MTTAALDVLHPLQLRQGETILGSLEVLYVDQPVFVCIFTPSASFDEIRPLFDQYAQLANKHDHAPMGDATLRAVSDKIRTLGLRLIAANGETDDFVLNIDDKRAYLSYNWTTVVLYEENKHAPA